MNAAIETADQGHHITLIEKSQKLGGRLEFADFLSFKKGVKNYREYLIRQVMKRESIKVLTGRTADRNMIESLCPDAVVVASGAKAYIPSIPGADLGHVIHSSDIFSRMQDLGDRVVIIGGGDVGCELTIQLQTMGKTVDLIEAEDKLMKYSMGFWEDKVFTEFFLTHEYRADLKNFDDLKEVNSVHVHLQSKCRCITEEGVLYDDAQGNIHNIGADSVILATGLRIDDSVFSMFEGLAETVLFIGDCRQPGNIEQATRDGYTSSLRI